MVDRAADVRSEGARSRTRHAGLSHDVRMACIRRRESGVDRRADEQSACARVLESDRIRGEGNAAVRREQRVRDDGGVDEEGTRGGLKPAPTSFVRYFLRVYVISIILNILPSGVGPHISIV